MTTRTLVWDPLISQAIQSPNNSGQEGSEIIGNFLYATEYFGSEIDIYAIDPTLGTLSYVNSFGDFGSGINQFGNESLVDLSFYELDDGSTKAYVADAYNHRVVVLDVDTTTGALMWDGDHTLTDTEHLSKVYGGAVRGDLLYLTDPGAPDIDIYKIDSASGGLRYAWSLASSAGSGINQFSEYSPVDITFFELEGGGTKAYAADGINQRIVVMDVDAATGALVWNEELTLSSESQGGEQYGLEVHEGVLYVTNYFGGGIDIYDIDRKTGALRYNHTVGTAGEEDNEFGTPIDLSFYTTTDGTTRAYITDSTNQRIAALSVVDDFAVSDNGILELGLYGESQLSLSPVQSNLAQISEVVVIKTDDATGSINGIAVGEEGYLAAAQSHSQVVFSVLGHDSYFPDLSLNRSIDIAGDDYLNFAVFQGGSFQSALDNEDDTAVLYGAQLIESGDTSQLNEVTIQVGVDRVEPATANSGAADIERREGIVLAIEIGDRTPPVGSAIQSSGPESEIIDLRHVRGTITAQFEVYRDADFDNVIGFFAVENVAGQVRNQQGGLLSPGEAGYVEAAIRNRIAIELSGKNGQVSRYSAEITGGQLLSSFLISNGSLAEWLDASTLNDPDIYFTHTGANSDRTDHIRLLGDNVFGFEDTAGGGDQDFNDIVVKASFSQAGVV